MTRIKIKRNPIPESKYYSVHTHSRYSVNDALPTVEEIVDRAKQLGYPALALTDHGNVAGSVKLYRACKKAGIKPMPGSEFYLVKDRNDKESKRYHFGLVAYTTEGYRNLLHISSRSHIQFYHKPILDLADLADLHEQGRTAGLALTTGCFFGLVVQSLVQHGYEAAKSIVACFASWFDVYVEVQSHNIEREEGSLTERGIARALASIAEELGLPLVITQDSHYVYSSECEEHDALKELVAFGNDVDDAKFPGDGFHLVDEKWMQEHHDPDIYERGIAGLQLLLSKYDMYIEEIEEYSYKVPSKWDDPMKELRKRVAKRMSELQMTDNKHWNAVKEELDVVEVARMAGYLLLTAEVCDHMREKAMFYQIRGSAAGSLLCYLLGITDLDPLKWKLRFDRFLSKDRSKPPDIDIDIDSERRDELVDWISNNYAVMQIGTYGTYSLAGDRDDGDLESDIEAQRGSLRVKYISRARKEDRSTDWEDIPDDDKQMLYRLSDMELCSGYGVHAAGLIVCNTKEELDKYVPVMYVASSKTFVSQWDMHDTEGIGLVKLDVLGVKTLTVIRRTLEMLGRDPADGLDFIPLTDKRVYRQIATGDTGGVFQLEGGTSAKWVRALRPTKIADVIAAMALFRPGVMSSGATETFLRRRRGEEKTPQQHSIIMKATKETYGILLYQDQVIEVLRDLGMDPDDLNVLLKAVKASNKNIHGAAETMTKYEPVVQKLCREAGMDESDVEWLWDALEAFAEYSFNRAHSTVYGITAYRCAYLLQHHPLQFHAALLTVASSDSKKEKKYTRITRSRGIRLLKPDVQSSGYGYAVDKRGRGVVRGLNAIDGIGEVAARAVEAAQPFADFDDFVERCNPSKVTGIKPFMKTGVIEVGVLEKLKDAGALESLGVE
jgi:DNA polymerase III subunit alpha